MNAASDDTRVFNQAMQWLSALQDGKATSAELFQWLAESPRHVEEFALALTFTDEIKGLTDAQCADIATMAISGTASSNVVPLSHAGAADLVPVPAEKPARSRRTAIGAIAASLLLATAAGTWMLWDGGWKTYETEISEQKTVDLSDGSTIQLNTHSRLKVRYGSASRDIQLVSGEALFKVERDPLRPFRVYTDASVIQAVGTSFNVYRRATDVRVAVIEGSVRISPNADASGTAQVLAAAGQEARFASEGPIVTRPVDVTQATAWRQRRLVFRNDTLADIVLEFNRYNRRPRFHIEDEEAGAQRFAATFDADAPQALVQVLEGTPGLSVEKRGDEIVIRRFKAD